MSRLANHEIALVALCLGVTTVADHYRWALIRSARHGRKRTRTRSGGVSAAAFGATFSAAGRVR